MPIHSETAETQGAHLVERSPLREEDHPNGFEMIETTGRTVDLKETSLPTEMILPGRTKEEET